MTRTRITLFDLDHTLLPIDSDYSWGEFTQQIGWTDPVEFKRRNDEFYAHYVAGTLDVHDYVRFDGKQWKWYGGDRNEKDVRSGEQPPIYEDRFSIMLDEGYHRRGIAPERIAAVLSRNAARLYHMQGKGAIAVGFDADLAIVDPDLERAVDPARLESFADYSPFEGMTLKGWPVMTLVRGRKVMVDGEITDAARERPEGHYLFRS